MRNGRSFQPVLMELVMVTLFLALAMSVIVQVLALAEETSAQSAFETRALLALEDAMERAKADPAGDGAFDGDGVRSFQTVSDAGVTVLGRVTARAYGAGTLYEIALTAAGKREEPMTLTGARYVPRGEVTQ